MFHAVYSQTLKMEAAGLSETLTGFCTSTWQHTLHSHRGTACRLTSEASWCPTESNPGVLNSWSNYLGLLLSWFT